ncbi:MAG: AGE family epimerase/isomerase [Capsulimonadaceae bacterium]
MAQVRSPYSDLIAGYVTSSNPAKGSFQVKTPGGDELTVLTNSATYAEQTRNLGDGWTNPPKAYTDMLATGQYVFAFGLWYPENGAPFLEAKHLVFPGPSPEEYVFEQADWWVNQIREIGDFYINGQFGSGEIDFRKYRTKLFLDGSRVDESIEVKQPVSRTVYGFAPTHLMAESGNTRQETDTISRTVYGFASAYLLTGEDRFLEAAEKGTRYLQDVMAKRDRAGIVYWLHAVDVNGNQVTEILPSQFGDDYGAMPTYEQIYAIAGPTQTYRINGDPGILSDIEKTIVLFDEYYKDKGPQGGYYSHLDPANFSATSEALGANKAKKNWNSVGDHAPAYLINLYLATGEEKYADFLAYTADTIEAHFPDYANSPFVNERFFTDWSHDQGWGWQQNRAVVGHNLKIAWNLLRIQSVRPNPKYIAFAEKIAGIMPDVGMDLQRGGWYDVMERSRQPGEEFHRLVYHDRKAWWQQEQGILAYLILNGVLKKPEYLKLARESSAFYNAWFLDVENGGVYFNTMADGVPYLLGNERLKGSHSMGAYHSTELGYLAQVYTNLLITKKPLNLYFSPLPGGFKNNTLYVSPDILPKGSIKIGEVTVDGKPYSNFDAAALTVTVPTSTSRVKIRVRIDPV